MTITLQLEPALETRLRNEAAKEGVDAGVLVKRAVEGVLRPESGPSATESELLLQITQGPAESTWQRYHELAAKRDARTLSPAEHQELIGLSEAIEASDVRRLEQMAQLAKLRGVPLRQIRSELSMNDPELSMNDPRTSAGQSNA